MTKIMVVDDDLEATNLLEGILKHQGFEVISVNDSRMAVQKADLANPDMFLLDLMMPEIDGFKLCTMLRQDRKFTFTPIIIITALNDMDSKAVSFGAGANDYITKPYLPTELLTKMRDLIQMNPGA
jgi:DNA-binding response OmpR family regulator